MKDLSFFVLKNNLASKMKKGMRNFCNNDDSTSTLNQHISHIEVVKNSPNYDNSPPKTLEEMILQLELEEEMARKAKYEHDDDDERPEIMHHRMSCVNNSDILRSARNALNQYPRFSLDGKDAMYRSSFRNLSPINTNACARRKSVCCSHGIRAQRGVDNLYKNVGFDSKLDKIKLLPTTLAGERVIWCKPGVVAKLMGLDAVPVPVPTRNSHSKERLNSVMRKQSLRKMAEKREMERRRLLVMEDINGYGRIRRGAVNGSSSKTGYCVMKPIPVVEPILLNRRPGWPTRNFV